MVQKVSVYGPGCKNCRALKENAEKAIEAIGGDVELDYVTDVVKMAEAGVMKSPALAVDGKVVSAGVVLKPGEIKELLTK